MDIGIPQPQAQNVTEDRTFLVIDHNDEPCELIASSLETLLEAVSEDCEIKVGTFSLYYSTGGKEIRCKNETNFKALCQRNTDRQKSIDVKVVMKDAADKPAPADAEESKEAVVPVTLANM